MTRPLTKDKPCLDYISYLEEKLKIYETSPYANTYLTIRGQIDSFNDQLRLGEEKTVQLSEEDGGGMVKVNAGRIDIFGSKDEKEFDRAWRYLNEAYDLHMKLDQFRSKMTEHEKKSVDEQLAGASFAEKGVFLNETKKTVKK